MARLAAWERQLGERMLAGLPDGARLWGLPTMAGRVPVFLVNFPGISSGMLSEELARLGFGVWSHGSYYALGLHDRIGWGEALRIGLAHYNTPDEIDRFTAVLADLVAAHRPGRGNASAAIVRADDLPEQQTPTGARTKRLLDTSAGDEPGLVRHQVHVPPAHEFGGTAATG